MKKHKLTGEGGKGSVRRDSNEQAYRDNWDKIFGGDRTKVNHKEQTKKVKKEDKDV
jgi:hypothetical protein